MDNIENNRILIDYFTFVSKIDDERTIIRLLGLEDLPFEEAPGLYFYSKSLRYENKIIILFGGHNLKTQMVRFVWIIMFVCKCLVKVAEFLKLIVNIVLWI